jgi:hypothetical protein
MSIIRDNNSFFYWICIKKTLQYEESSTRTTGMGECDHGILLNGKIGKSPYYIFIISVSFTLSIASISLIPTSISFWRFVSYPFASSSLISLFDFAESIFFLKS